MRNRRWERVLLSGGLGPCPCLEIDPHRVDLLRNNSLPRPTGAYFLGLNVTVVGFC